MSVSASPFPAVAEDCSTKETTRAAVVCLQAKIEARARGRVEVLAAVRVQDGTIVSSSDGVKFDRATGIVTFKNPGNLQFVPVITDFENNAYITETHFVREIVTVDKFKVWRKPLDTGARNGPPTSFTAIVVGF
jgi:hypothetical protein